MSRLTEMCQLGKDTITGHHDADLEELDAAIKYRKKLMFRPGMKFKIVGTKNPALDGLTATVLKVNPTRIGCGVGEATEEYGRKTWSGGEYNFPPRMLAPLES